MFPRDGASDEGWIGVQTGALYTKSGFASNEQNASSGYICIPFDIQIYPSSNYYVSVGPEVCMCLSFNQESIKHQGVTLFLNGHKANDVKIGIGVGYDYHIIKTATRNHSIGIGLKYLVGTSDFADNLPWKGNQLRITFIYKTVITRF